MVYRVESHINIQNLLCRVGFQSNLKAVGYFFIFHVHIILYSDHIFLGRLVLRVHYCVRLQMTKFRGKSPNFFKDYILSAHKGFFLGIYFCQNSQTETPHSSTARYKLINSFRGSFFPNRIFSIYGSDARGRPPCLCLPQ